MNSSSESVSPRRFASIPHSSSKSGMHPMKALPAFPLLAKYVLNELEMVLRSTRESGVGHSARRLEKRVIERFAIGVEHGPAVKAQNR